MNPTNNVQSHTIVYKKTTDSILLLLWSATCMIISQLYKKYLKRKYKNLKNSKIYSLKEFYKNKKNLVGKDVILIGKYLKETRDIFSDSFYLIDNSKLNLYLSLTKKYILIHPNYFYFLNPRQGFVEKSPVNFNISSYLSSFFLSHKLLQSLECGIDHHSQNKKYRSEYFLDGDMIGVYGTVTNREDTIYSINPTFIFQGNYMILKNMLKSQIGYWDISFKFFAISFVCETIACCMKYFRNLWLGKYSFQSDIKKSRVNCIKCKINVSNVVMNDCNHFNTCYKCFKEMDETCRLCNKRIDDYYVLCDKR